MTRVMIVVMTSLALGAVTFGQANDERTNEQAFVEGGIVTLSLSSGDYTVRAGASDRIRVEWRAREAKDEKDMREIRVISDVFDGIATIRTKGPTNRARFTIEVPARSDVHLRMRAGDVRIEGIEGNKDVRMRAGDLHIDVQPDTLRHVHASVSIGDLTARSLGIETDPPSRRRSGGASGFGNSLDWFGEGPYTLDARLFVGDVVLR